MLDSLFNSTGLTFVFTITAIGGGLLFLIRIVLQLLGSDDVDMDADFDFDDSDHGFQFLSLHGLSAFFLIFGLVGLALLVETGAGEFLSVAGGILAGLGSMAISGKIFQMMSRLQSSGTLKVESAIGSQGTVYLSIPAQGRGKVQVTVRDRLREFEAVSADEIEIATGDSIEVVGIIGANVLSVRRV